MNKLLLSGVAALTTTLALPLMAQDAGPGQKGPKGPRPPMMDKIFEKIDIDNSGGISLKEMQDETLTRTQERFDKLDANKDGQVTKDEFKPPRRMEHKGPGKHHDRKGRPDRDCAPEDAPEDAPNA